MGEFIGELFSSHADFIAAVLGHVCFGEERVAAVEEEWGGEIGGIDLFRPGAGLDVIEEALEFGEVAAVDVEGVGDVDVFTGVDIESLSDAMLEFSEGVHIHEGGFECVVGSHVDDHIEFAVLDTEPEALEAGGIGDAEVVPGLPGDGLGAASEAAVFEESDAAVDLVDVFDGGLSGVVDARDAVIEESFMVGIFPHTGGGVDPMVVDAEEDFGAVFFEVVEAAGEGAMNAWFGEGVSDVDHGGDIAAIGVVGFVVLCGEALAEFPAGEDGVFPSDGECIFEDVDGAHGGDCGACARVGQL